eukprot:1185940-Prorocentrum_minimum.AAC.4
MPGASTSRRRSPCEEVRVFVEIAKAAKTLLLPPYLAAIAPPESWRIRRLQELQEKLRTAESSNRKLQESNSKLSRQRDKVIE